MTQGTSLYTYPNSSNLAILSTSLGHAPCVWFGFLLTL